MTLIKYLNLKKTIFSFLLLSFIIYNPVGAQVAEISDNAQESLGKVVSYYLLLFFLIIVFVAIIGRVIKVYELTRTIQGKDDKFAWDKIQGTFFGIALLIGCYGAYWSLKNHGSMILPEAASVHGEKWDVLFWTTVAMTVFVFFATHILLFMFAFKYKRTADRKAYFYPHNNRLEFFWTIIPMIALTVLVLFGFFTWRSITNISEKDKNSALNVEVTAEQFKWTVRYPGKDGKIGRKNYKLITPANGLGLDLNDKKNFDDLLAGDMVIPVNEPVRVTLGSKDVLHSFYLPHFRVQMNCVPGMPTFFQFTPKYTTEQMREKVNDPKFDFLFLCAKICGGGHYNMQVKVKVVSKEEYKEWLNKQALICNDDLKAEFFKSKSLNHASLVTKSLVNSNL